MKHVTIPFTPSLDVAAILHILLDVYERRNGASRHAIRVKMNDASSTLPGYYSQTNPAPRATANEQLAELKKLQLVRLKWLSGQEGHLLDTVTLQPGQAEPLYALLKREPLDKRRQRLSTLLLGDRFRLLGWRRRAVDHCLSQLKAGKSPGPFNLDDDGWNQDLITALLALSRDEHRIDVKTEIPYRVFSVRVFNDSKRFESFKGAIARMARRHQPEWRDLSNQEALRELGLVPNPGHLYLYGPWQLVDDYGQVMSLSEFYPSVGIPTAMASRVRQVRVDAARVVCVENLTPFYELIRHQGQGLAALCLWGNPSPVIRHLLRCLTDNLPSNIPLLLWADIDYGGLNILAQLRQQVSDRFLPCYMDQDTLENCAYWAQPLSSTDERNLARLKQHPALTDMVPLIDYMLLRGIKLEQEAVAL
ncbi:MAG: DUF2399 domain-containing protein [Chloroflexi bacterium]|nr:DUF2399 domain-containing protein [Chloroflexota bacterium]